MTNVTATALPDTWGVRPVLFTAGSVRVESYPFFMALALVVGLFVFVFFSRNQKKNNEQSTYIILAALVGGTLGAKIPIWLMQLQSGVSTFTLETILSGRTIVGGLIGGTLAVWWIKRRMGIKQRIGNAIAPALAAGIAVGRIGCFLRGCCFGIPTSLPWGVNFGDGIPRHPTELYESLFGVIAFVVLVLLLRKKRPDGILLTGFMIAYFLFRFMIEFIRVEPRVLFGLTGYQYAAMAVLVYYAIKLVPPALLWKR